MPSFSSTTLAAYAKALSLQQPGQILPELRLAIETHHREAKDGYASLDFEDGEFAEYTMERLPEADPGDPGVWIRALTKLHSADLALAMQCAAENEQALGIFDAEVLPIALAAGHKLSLGDRDSDELRQDVRTRILLRAPEKGEARIAGYAGVGSLRAWVYATALRTGLNELRRRGRAPVPQGDEQLLVSMPDDGDDQELRYMKSLYRDAFGGAFRTALSTLELRLANVLRHYYLDEMTMEEIGHLYRVHKSTVMRWMNKAHEHLQVETKREMVSHLQLRPTEVESVLRLIQSGIQLGLASALVHVDDS